MYVVILTDTLPSVEWATDDALSACDHAARLANIGVGNHCTPAMWDTFVNAIDSGDDATVQVADCEFVSVFYVDTDGGGGGRHHEVIET